MGVFAVLLLVPVMMQHFVIKPTNINYEKKNRNALFFFFVFFTVLVMLRHESVGNDTRNYIYFFNKFSQLSWGDVGRYNLEAGYSYFNKIVSVFTKNPQVFFAITAVLIIAMIYPTYKRLCVDASLTVVLFCTMSTFVMMFSGIRQMIAVGLGFIAYEFTRKKKLLPFVFTVILATAFHASGFIIAFMYPLYRLKITKKLLFAAAPVLAFVFVFNRQIFSVLTVILKRFSRFDGQVTSTGAYTMLLVFAVFVAFAFIIPDESKIDEETIGLRNFLLLSLVVQMFAPVHTLAMRINYYYIIFIPLLLPKIVQYRSARYRQVAVLGRHIMVAFFLIYFFISARNGGLHVFPYHFFWEAV